MAATLLDASALLAYLHREPGGDEVRAAIVEGSAINIVNLTEVLSTLAAAGVAPDAAMAELAKLQDGLAIVALEVEDAPAAGRLRPLTRDLGLSLADRLCLAVSMRLGLPVLTADAAWAKARIEVEIRLIR